MPTVQNVIDTIIAEIPGAPFEKTVDTFKTGDPAQEVRGIVTTFLASYAVIEQAVTQDANLIITHEPTFYNHEDGIDWLANDPVYQEKRRLINEHGIVIWRFHDYWHTHRPDGIITGVLKQLGWQAYAQADREYLCTLPPTTVADLAGQIKAKLASSHVRVVGDPALVCRRLALIVGAPGGRMQIEVVSKTEVDALICGEINEWETSEYVRDAIALGRQVALLVIGHQASEEAGMAWLVEWLPARLPDLPIVHIPTGDPFQIL